VDPDLGFHFDADPDPSFHSDADPDPAAQNDADPEHCPKPVLHSLHPSFTRYFLFTLLHLFLYRTYLSSSSFTLLSNFSSSVYFSSINSLQNLLILHLLSLRSLILYLLVLPQLVPISLYLPVLNVVVLPLQNKLHGFPHVMIQVSISLLSR
jgi:hypothetical protein